MFFRVQRPFLETRLRKILETVFENPWLVGIVGGLITIAAAVWWLNSGRREGILVAIGVLVLTLGLVALGIRVETEQESLRVMLYQTADDLQNNRKNQIMTTIYELPTDAVIEAKGLLNQKSSTFEYAAIKKIHSIEFSGPPSARRAIVKMNVFVEGTFGGYQAKAPQYVEVTLYRVNDRWLVYDFLRDNPMVGIQER